MPSENGNKIEDGTYLAESLQVRCQKLLQELEDFRSFIEERKAEHENTVDIRKFQVSVRTEYRSLQKLAESDLTAEKTIHTLRSSNLPFYAATWNAAKATRALTAFHKRFYWEERPTRESKKAAERRCALVDIVACDGEEWIKVSTITEDRLKFEIAKAEWEAANYSSDEEEEDQEGDVVNESTNRYSNAATENDLDRIELVQSAKDFLRASRAHRVHYKHPQVRFILPKISANPPPELYPVLDRIRSTGAIIDLGPQDISSQAPGDIMFSTLLPSPHPPMTPTLNVDCTILLALVSDLSHTANHPILPGYNAAITRQIELETRDNLLPSKLWPAMAEKDLVCTEEAANRMKEIVDTIGMPKEKSRAELLLIHENGDPTKQDGEALRQSFAKYSDYPIPPTWRLPIRIHTATVSPANIESAVQSGTLPAVAEQVAELLTDINRSVFMHGWMKGITTVSSNRTVTKVIEGIVEKNGEGAMGPDIWLREPARSLLGKEKERRK